MAVSARKHTVPAEGETPRFEAINELGASINDIVPVANTTERAQLLADLGWAPSAARPLYVHRADTSAALEYTTDGTNWRPVGGIEHFDSGAPAGTTVTGSALNVTANLAAAPFTRLVIAHAGVYGTPTSGIWDAALSIGVPDVGSAQVYHRFAGSASQSVSMTYQAIVPANTEPLVRTWMRFVSGSSPSLGRSGDSRFTYIRGIAIAL